MDVKDELIARIYETAISPGDWGELLEALVRWAPDRNTTESGQAPIDSATLLDHLARATRTSDRAYSLEDQNRRLEDMANRLPWPMLMLDNDLRVVSRNAAARHYLVPDFPVSVSWDDTFQVTDPGLRRELRDTMALRHGRGSRLLRSGHQRLALLCMPVQHSDAPDDSASITTVVWVFTGRGLAPPAPGTLAALFSLTPAESRLLHVLCKVGNLTRSAELLSVSHHTARSQMKAIMSKVGVRSQVALVSETMSHGLLSRPGAAPTGENPEHTLSLPDGRVLSWYEYGDEHGRPILVLENQGGLLPCHQPHHHWYARRGWRVIVVVRPGLGISSPHPGAGLTDFADDLREFCGRLGLRRPALGAYCFGAAFALSAAARHPDLFERVGVIGGVVPPEYLDVKGLDPMNRMLWRLAEKDPRLFLYLGRLALRGINKAPEQYFKYFAKSAYEKDARMITDPALLDGMIRQMKQRWFQGARVILDECMLMQRPWGVNLADIHAPTLLWHGRHDGSISLASARRTAAAIPGADFQELPDEGRYPVFNRWRDFLDAVFALPRDGSRRMEPRT